MWWSLLAEKSFETSSNVKNCEVNLLKAKNISLKFELNFNIYNIGVKKKMRAIIKPIPEVSSGSWTHWRTKSKAKVGHFGE